MHGSITYMVNYYTEHIWDIDVDKYNFIPSPKVDSKVIGLKFREEPYPKVSDEKIYFDIIFNSFSMYIKILFYNITTNICDNSFNNRISVQKINKKADDIYFYNSNFNNGTNCLYF